MAQITVELPTVGGDEDTWGDKNNIAHTRTIAGVNSHDDRITALEVGMATLAVRVAAAEANIAQLQAAVAALGGGTPGDGGTTPPVGTTNTILTELGDRLVTEAGDGLGWETSTDNTGSSYYLSEASERILTEASDLLTTD